MHDRSHSPTSASSTAFAPAVRQVIAALRAGEVVTYGEVAREAGHVGAARAVGTLLAREGSDLPWWRIVSSTGRLVPGHEHEHARRLRAEGVYVAGVPPRVRRARLHAGDNEQRQPARRRRGEASS
jgi:methylated-DNA-protein-cysteine methyltransferase-like protein